MFAFTELWLVHLLVRRLGGTDTEVAMLNILPMAAIAVLGVFAGPLITLLGGIVGPCYGAAGCNAWAWQVSSQPSMLPRPTGRFRWRLAVAA